MEKKKKTFHQKMKTKLIMKGDFETITLEDNVS
jgi:hypothetical protein